MRCNCIADHSRFQYVLDLRGRIFGKQRLILADTPCGMNHPMRICSQPGMETKYDTETLLKVLMFRIFGVIGYDYSGVRIVLGEGWCQL